MNQTAPELLYKASASVLKQHSVTEQIAIEFEKRQMLKEAA